MPVRKRDRRGTKECLRDWGFKQMPFDEETSPSKVWAGSTENLDYLKYVLDDILDDRMVASFLLAGDYGSGKSYHMRALQEYVNEDMGGLGVYFNFPEKVRDRGFKDILEGFMTAVGSDVIFEVGQELIKKKKAKDRKEFIGMLKEIGIDRDLRFVLANLVKSKGTGNVFNASWAWITGRASYRESKSLQLLSNPQDEPAALRVISGVLNYLGTKYGIIALFIDELEHLRGRSKAARSAREGLRSLYDALITQTRNAGVAVFFAATSQVWIDLAQTLKGALRDRMDDEIRLKPLTEKQARAFVRDLFRYARKGDDDGVSPPFSDEAAFNHFIANVTGHGKRFDSRELGITGTPRRIIKMGKTLIRKSCLKQVDSIKGEDVKAILGSERVETDEH